MSDEVLEVLKHAEANGLRVFYVEAPTRGRQFYTVAAKSQAEAVRLAQRWQEGDDPGEQVAPDGYDHDWVGKARAQRRERN